MNTTLEIPADWSPEQSLAVATWLDQLITAIWTVHGDAIWAYIDQLPADRRYEVTVAVGTTAEGDIF